MSQRYIKLSRIFFLLTGKNKDNTNEYSTLETTPKHESIKMNNESIYQKNKTNEPEINISLVLTTQKTPNSETTKAFQSQFLSLSWASTRKHDSVSLISLEVTKASPIASDVQFTTPKQKSKLPMVSLHTPKNESIYNSGPTTMHSPRNGSSRKSSILVNIQKLTLIKDEINTKLIRATTANYSATNTIISTLVTMPIISSADNFINHIAGTSRSR